MIWVFRYGKNTEGYSEPSQTSKMEHFAKIVICFRQLTIFAKSSILYVWLASEYAFGALCFFVSLSWLVSNSSKMWPCKILVFQSTHFGLNTVNPLQFSVAFLYSLKTSENLKDVFRGYRKATPGCNGLIVSIIFRKIKLNSTITSFVDR